MVYLLMFAIAASLDQPPMLGTNCEAMTIDNAMASALAMQATLTNAGGVCQKRDGVYEWVCASGSSMFTITIKKDPEDCKATPNRTLNQLRTLMKKPTF